MIWNIEPIWLVMALGAVATLGFFLGHAFDAILREDGFGPFVTMFIFIVGFFGGIYLANTQGITLRDLTRAVGTGVSGALALIAALVVLKAGITRLAR